MTPAFGRDEELRRRQHSLPGSWESLGLVTRRVLQQWETTDDSSGPRWSLLCLECPVSPEKEEQ